MCRLSPIHQPWLPAPVTLIARTRADIKAVAAGIVARGGAAHAISVAALAGGRYDAIAERYLDIGSNLEAMVVEATQKI